MYLEMSTHLLCAVTLLWRGEAVRYGRPYLQSTCLIQGKSTQGNGKHFPKTETSSERGNARPHLCCKPISGTMRRGSVAFSFLLHFNNNVQGCFNIIEALKEMLVLVAKRLELHPIGALTYHFKHICCLIQSQDIMPSIDTAPHLQFSFLVPTPALSMPAPTLHPG